MNPTRRFLGFAVFAIVLAVEVFLLLLVPQVDPKLIHDFLLVSMGLAFIPLFIALAIAAVLLVLMLLVPYLVSKLALRSIGAGE